MSKKKADTAAGHIEPVEKDESQMEQIKQDLIKRLKQREHDLPYLVRASGCTATRDYLTGHINELREILKTHFDYKGEE